MDLLWNGQRILTPGGGLHLVSHTGPIIPVNQLTSWTNTDFDTFSSTGIVVNSAIEGLGTVGHCKSNAVFVTGAFPGSGGTIQFIYYLTVNSGSYPNIEYYKNGISQGSGSQGYAGPAEYQMSFLVYSPGNYTVGFSSRDTTGTNFTATNCRMYTTSGI